MPRHNVEGSRDKSGPVSGDLVAVSVQLGENSEGVDRKRMLEKLFAGVQFDGTDNVTWDGNRYCAVKNDRLKSKLFALFGANLSLDAVDANIESLVKMELGWLEQKSNDTVEIRNGEISADLEQICQLVMSSLSPDIVNKVKTLCENIHSILSGDSYFANTQQIDVNLFQKNQHDITCIHTRYTALTKKKGVRIFFLGGKKRSIQINFNLRKIGISKTFADDLLSDLPSIVLRDGVLCRNLPEPGRLVAAQTEPCQTSSHRHHIPAGSSANHMHHMYSARSPIDLSPQPISRSFGGVPVHIQRPFGIYGISQTSTLSIDQSPTVSSKVISYTKTPIESSRSKSAPPIPLLSVPSSLRQIELSTPLDEGDMPEFL